MILIKLNSMHQLIQDLDLKFDEFAYDILYALVEDKTITRRNGRKKFKKFLHSAYSTLLSEVLKQVPGEDLTPEDQIGNELRRGIKIGHNSCRTQTIEIINKLRE